MTAELRFIGHIETPYEKISDCPFNIEEDGPMCKLVLAPEYEPGLLGLKKGKKILVLYWFEDVERMELQGKSRKTGKFCGVFAKRSPHRPNPIAAAVLPIEDIEGPVVYVKGLDCINGTPLVDIKPANLSKGGKQQ